MKSRFTLLLLCAGAFALRVFTLDASGFWYDEAFTAWIVAKDWAGILDFARAPKLEHPPAYYFLLNAWQSLAGDSEFSLRFFSLFFSVLAVVLIYRLARRWFGGAAAAWALAVAAASPFMVVYAQEARMYTLALCAALLSLDYFMRWLDGDRRVAPRYAFWLAASISIHYYAALILPVEHLLALLARPRTPRFWRDWLAGNIALGLAALAVLAVAPGPRETLVLVFSNPLFSGRSADELRRVLTDLLIGGVVIRPLPAWAPAAAGVMALAAAGGLWVVLRGARRRDAPYRLLLLLLVVPPLAAATVPYVYAARYLFLAVPALIMLCALAFDALRARPRWLALALLVFALANGFGLWLNYGSEKSPYRAMAAIVTGKIRAGDAVIQHGTSQWPLAAYYLRGVSPQQTIPAGADAAELADIDAAMRALQMRNARLWVMSEQSYVVDPGNNVPRWLALNAYPVARFWFVNNQAVALYASGRDLQPPRLWQQPFGEWLHLEQAALSGTSAAPGDSLAIELKWHALKKIPQPLQLLVTLRLVDASGRVVAERLTKPCDGFCAIDDWIPGESVADRHGLSVPANAPPGDYHLRLSVFSPRQNADLPVAGGSALELAVVHVGLAVR